MSHRKRLYLVDSHNLIHRAFHSIEMVYGRDGQPINAATGFIRNVMSLQLDLKPDYLICVFDDHVTKSFRHTLYTHYKAQRGENNPELQSQFALVEELLHLMRIPVVRCADYECDDIVATIVNRPETRTMDVSICTNDKDFRQLIRDNVRLFDIRTRQTMDAEFVKLDWGIAPHQVVDYLTLLGDSSDNVPGVNGVGKVTALRLLEQFNSIDNMIANLDQISSGFVRARIERALQDGTLAVCQRLIRLAIDAPIDVNWTAWQKQPWDIENLDNYLHRLGVKNMYGLLHKYRRNSN